jgi:hypothetical protein
MRGVNIICGDTSDHPLSDLPNGIVNHQHLVTVLDRVRLLPSLISSFLFWPPGAAFRIPFFEGRSLPIHLPGAKEPIMFGLLKVLRRPFRSSRPTSRRRSAHRAFFEQLGGPLFAPATPSRRPGWKPAVEALEERSLLSTTSAVAWTSGGATHSALYAVGPNDNVEVSVDGGSFTNLGGYAKQISAGLDVFNNPEVYAIGADNAVWLNKGSGWVSLGGYLKEISATVENTIYAIGTDDNIYLSHGAPGLGWFNTGLKARQISAGADAIGNPEVYAIGFNNNVYAGNGSGGPAGFANWGSYAKQISATIDSTVYAIGADNAVYKNSGSGSGSGWVSLGGYAKQISAGIDGAFGPFVFAIGLDDGLWSNHGSSWTNLGGYVTQINGPSISSFGVHPPADLAYAVAPGSHAALLHQGASFATPGGYVQLASGSASDNTDSWQPATRDTSAVSWRDPTGRAHTTLYAIAPDDTAEVSVDGNSFTNLGGFSKQISAGLDAIGNPEVYAIGGDNAVYLNKGSGWVRLGGYAKEISATVNNTFYHIGTDDAVYLGHGVAGTGFIRLGGQAKQISAGADIVGNPEVFIIGFNDAVFVNNGSGYVNLGGYAKQITATLHDTVYAIGGDNAIYENSGGSWVSLGGYAKQISASVSGANGSSVVFAIGLNDSLYSNHGTGWVSLGGYVTEISAPAVGNFGINFSDPVYAIGQGHNAMLHTGTTFNTILGDTVE